jgi:hypothetical protein
VGGADDLGELLLEALEAGAERELSGSQDLEHGALLGLPDHGPGKRDDRRRRGLAVRHWI